MQIHTGTIIKTQATKARNPGIAFLLSFVCTGLGQVYNGELAKGAAFGLLRSLPLFLAPLLVLKQHADSYITSVLVLLLACAVILLASSLESLLRARGNRKAPGKAYNSLPGYGIFVLVNIAITALSIIFLSSFFSIERASDKNAGPIIDPGDYILVKRYHPEGFTRGELVLLDNGSVGRIMALGGDRVKYLNNVFYINGSALPLGFLNDGEIGRFAAFKEDVVSEFNEGKKYAIRFKISAAVTFQCPEAPLKKNEVLVAADQRVSKDFARTAPLGRLRGRIEGVIFSSDPRKIGLDAYAGLR